MSLIKFNFRFKLSSFRQINHFSRVHFVHWNFPLLSNQFSYFIHTQCVCVVRMAASTRYDSINGENKNRIKLICYGVLKAKISFWILCSMRLRSAIHTIHHVHSFVRNENFVRHKLVWLRRIFVWKFCGDVAIAAGYLD